MATAFLAKRTFVVARRPLRRRRTVLPPREQPRGGTSLVAAVTLSRVVTRSQGVAVETAYTQGRWGMVRSTVMSTVGSGFCCA